MLDTLRAPAPLPPEIDRGGHHRQVFIARAHNAAKGTEPRRSAQSQARRTKPSET